jgi:hypothetical protein
MEVLAIFFWGHALYLYLLAYFLEASKSERLLLLAV